MYGGKTVENANLVWRLSVASMLKVPNRKIESLKPMPIWPNCWLALLHIPAYPLPTHHSHHTPPNNYQSAATAADKRTHSGGRCDYAWLAKQDTSLICQAAAITITAIWPFGLIDCLILWPCHCGTSSHVQNQHQHQH